MVIVFKIKLFLEFWICTSIFSKKADENSYSSNTSKKRQKRRL